jgi:hypothetical protein
MITHSKPLLAAHNSDAAPRRSVEPAQLLLAISHISLVHFATVDTLNEFTSSIARTTGSRKGMHSENDLELFSTRELIAELMRRRTFLGVVVHSEQELKERSWNDERVFKVHFNGNLDSFEAGRLLESVASRIIIECD